MNQPTINWTQYWRCPVCGQRSKYGICYPCGTQRDTKEPAPMATIEDLQERTRVGAWKYGFGHILPCQHPNRYPHVANRPTCFDEEPAGIENLCPHGFPPADGCFECLGVDMLDWVTPRHEAVIAREYATGALGTK